MNRYLVTGGAGFIGSNLVGALLARGAAVTVLDDFSTGFERNLDSLSGDLEVVRGSIIDANCLERAFRDVGAVLHQAAMASVARSIEEPSRCDEINVHGTVRVLAAAKAASVPRVVFAASAAAYGDAAENPKRETMTPAPLSPYAVSKVAGEHYLAVFARLYGMMTISLRYFNVYGPKQDPASEYAAAIPKFVQKLLRNQRPQVFGDGEQTRDFCYIDDVVAANLKALTCANACGQVVNIASGTTTTVNELVGLLKQEMNATEPVEHVAPRAGDIRHSTADVSRANDLLGFRAATSLTVGLKATVDYFRKQGEESLA